MQRLIIPGRLPGWNEMDAGHWAERNRIKSEAMEIVGWEIKRQRIKPVSGKAVVKIVCYEPSKRRDPSNVRSGAEKIILDALQKHKIIRNDNWRWLDDTPAVVDCDRKYPRIEVTISEG